MAFYEISLVPLEGGTASVVTLGAGVSNQSGVFDLNRDVYVIVTPTVDVFLRQGTNPTALSTGVDQILLANNMYRVGPIARGNRLAFISASAGSVYLTPHG